MERPQISTQSYRRYIRTCYLSLARCQILGYSYTRRKAAMKKILASLILCLALVALWGLNTDSITIDSPAISQSMVPHETRTVNPAPASEPPAPLATSPSDTTAAQATPSTPGQNQAQGTQETAHTPEPITAAQPPSPSAVNTAPVPVTPAPVKPALEPAAADLFTTGAREEAMLAYINAARAAVNLPPLTLDPILCKGAYIKSKDMAVNGYFSHTSPTYGDCFQMMDDLGVKRTYAGENIAINTSVSSAHQAFMNSPGHRANILNTRFREVGLGFYESGGRLYVTQWFTD